MKDSDLVARVNAMARDRIQERILDLVREGEDPASLGRTLQGIAEPVKAAPIREQQPIHIHMPPVVMPDSFTVDVPPPNITVEAPIVNLPAPVTHVAAPVVNIPKPDPTVVNVDVPAPVVNVEAGKATDDGVKPVFVVNMPEPHDYAVKRDATGRIKSVEPV